MRHWLRFVTLTLALASTIIPAHPVFAQSTVTEIVSFLVTNQAVRTGAPERDQEASEITRDTITRALLVNLTSVPIATSSSGFLYRLNPQLGTVERATDNFGGFFIERALTPGHGRASFGISASASTFDRLDDEDLEAGTLLTIANRFRDEAAPFDTETLKLDVRSSSLTAYASVGITDRLEIGGAVPFVKLTIEGERVNVYRGSTFLQSSGTATASGIADSVLRAKYTVVTAGAGGVAIAAEVRLPTGNADNLLGAGASAFRLLGIGTMEQGPVMLSGNVGIVRGGGDISDEFTFGGAAAAAVHPRLSLIAEVLARNVADLRPIAYSTQPHPTVDGADTIRLVAGDPGRLIARGITGFKWNPASTIVIGTNVRWNFTTAGLTSPVTLAVGLEYGF